MKPPPLRGQRARAAHGRLTIGMTFTGWSPALF